GSLLGDRGVRDELREVAHAKYLVGERKRQSPPEQAQPEEPLARRREQQQHDEEPDAEDPEVRPDQRPEARGDREWGGPRPPRHAAVRAAAPHPDERQEG